MPKFEDPEWALIKAGHLWTNQSKNRIHNYSDFVFFVESMWLTEEMEE